MSTLSLYNVWMCLNFTGMFAIATPKGYHNNSMGAGSAKME